MDRVNGYFEPITISSLAKRWSHLSLFEKVYAHSQPMEKVTEGSIFEGTSENSKEQEETVAKNSGEYLKMRREDPKLMALVEIDLKEHMLKETGMDRVKDMYTGWRAGYSIPELELAYNVGTSTGTMVFVLSSFLGGRMAAEKFCTKNQHTAFTTSFIASRKYNDAIMIGSIRLGLKMGVKTGVLSGLFVLSSQTLAMYRNKTSIWDYIAGGGVVCSIMRTTHGWRNMVVGGVLGAVLGLVGGTFIIGLLKITNMTQEQRHKNDLIERFIKQREFENPSQSDTVAA